jgi:hypothetical protein
MSFSHRTLQVTGGAEQLSGDVIFSAADCEHWDVPWAAGGCIGSGEASILRVASGYMYQVIEVADVALTCDLTRGEQWWLVHVTNGRNAPLELECDLLFVALFYLLLQLLLLSVRKCKSSKVDPCPLHGPALV